MAREIDSDSEGGPLTLIGVLKGSFIFLADLIRAMQTPVTVDFVALHSYGRSISPGDLRLVKDFDIPVRDRKVLLVDDIIDTGLTTRYLLGRIKRRRPRWCRVCTLLDKPSRRVAEVPIDYRGLIIPDRFVVGYGLDFDERYRQLPGIFSLEQTKT
jgi:hypoxanthine phosphoribosyltransferase